MGEHEQALEVDARHPSARRLPGLLLPLGLSRDEIHRVPIFGVAAERAHLGDIGNRVVRRHSPLMELFYEDSNE